MKINLGKKDAKIIVWELECTLGSIQLHESRKEKGDITIKNFREFDMSDFDLKHMELTKSEYETIIRLLDICSKILCVKQENQS